MPNQINPFNYNIDNFDSGFLGPITDTNFRTFLFTHNLTGPNPIVAGVISNPWVDLGTEYDVSQSTFNVVDVPNLQTVAQTPSLYNNLTNPRQVNLTNNLQDLNPEVQNTLGQTTPIQAGLGQDATTLFNPNTSNLDLPNVDQAATVSSPINDFTTPRLDNLLLNPTGTELSDWYSTEFDVLYNQWSGNYNTPYGVPSTLRIGFAGNIENLVNAAGIQIPATTYLQRDILKSENRRNTRYGPTQIVAYSFGSDQLLETNTGLVEYNIGIENDFRDQLLSYAIGNGGTLGVGVIPFSTLGSGINYKPDGVNISELDSIARKRRGEEVINRVKLNFVDNTIGKLNVSPLNLLAGGNLIEQDYTITVRKTRIGKAAQFLADLVGFNLPKSIIPDGAFGYYGNEGTVNSREIDVSNDILDYTGSGQKSLLYNALYINKYGPVLESAANPPKTKLGEILKGKLGAGQPPATINYLTDPNENAPPENEGERRSSVIDIINQKIKNLVGKSKENAEDLRPDTYFDTVPIEQAGSQGGFYGRFELDGFVGKDTSEDSGFNLAYYSGYGDQAPTTYNGTVVEKSVIPSFTNEKFDWRATKQRTFNRGLLKYTQKLVNDAKLKSAAGYIGYFDSDGISSSPGQGGAIVNGKHITGVAPSKIPTAPTRPSKGNVATDYNFQTNTGGEYYCRSWSSRRKYHKWENLVRSDGNWWRGQEKFDDLTMNYEGNHGGDFTGVPKIAWNSVDQNITQQGGIVADVINGETKLKGQMIPYMFSIENLAWKDAPQQIFLPNCEIGPNGGRIMWFPPYDIKFSDNSTVSWDTTNFIGRGEPIYTYNHSERSGTLDWKIIIDHSNAMNELRKRFKKILSGDEVYNSYFAGCDINTLKSLFATYLSQNQTAGKTPTIQNLKPKAPASYGKTNYYIHFEHNQSAQGQAANIGRELNFDYEVTVPSLFIDKEYWYNDYINYPCGPSGPAPFIPYHYLNTLDHKFSGATIFQQLTELAKWLTTTEDGKNHKIKIIGYTSAPSSSESNFNKELGLARARSVKDWLLKTMLEFDKSAKEIHLQGNDQYPTYPKETDLATKTSRWAPVEQAFSSSGKEYEEAIKKDGPPIGDGNPCQPLDVRYINSHRQKIDRVVNIVIEPNTEEQVILLKEVKKQEQPNASNTGNDEIDALRNSIVENFITECEYFEAMKREQPFVYQSLAEKIQYFHPAFHSMTPEGFNSRLTFLQQCTRQGPQIIDPTVPSNMVFGRPPICVLRIGDFYHTKIVIDSVNIDYDPLQWDLNPEGIGVQPMVANVSIAFKFIGGSSLGGPITQLQNAVSYNFFANTSVYRPATLLELDKLAGGKMAFIYGAFRSPAEEKTLMNRVNDINLGKVQKDVQQQNQNLAVDLKALATPPVLIDENDQTTIDELTETPPPPPPDPAENPTSPTSNGLKVKVLSTSTTPKTGQPFPSKIFYVNIQTTKNAQGPVPPGGAQAMGVDYLVLEITGEEEFKSSPVVEIFLGAGTKIKRNPCASPGKCPGWPSNPEPSLNCTGEHECAAETSSPERVPLAFGFVSGSNADSVGGIGTPTNGVYNQVGSGTDEYPPGKYFVKIKKDFSDNNPVVSEEFSL